VKPNCVTLTKNSPAKATGAHVSIIGHVTADGLLVHVARTLERCVRPEDVVARLGGDEFVVLLPESDKSAIASKARLFCDIVAAVGRGIEQYGLTAPELGMEPGRSIVGEAGATLYTIGPIKTVPIQEAPGHRTYVAVDGGLSDNPRPLMYDARYPALIADRADQPARRAVRVSGKHCETDTLLPEATLADPQPGDILAVLDTGAYNYAMASNYNRFPKPAVVAVVDGQARLWVRRETIDDVLRCDV